MPIARFEMPDGKIARFEVPEGTTPEQAQQMIAESLGQKAEQGTSFKQTAGNVLAGAARGAGSIGATIMAPIDAAARAVNINNSIIGRTDRREAMDSALGSMGAETDSLAYQGGKLGAEIAGTAGAGGLVGNAALRAAPIVAKVAPSAASVMTKLAPAIESGGLTLGSNASSNAIANLLLRTGGGAVNGAVSAGLVNPEDAGTGALIGGALPSAVKVAGATGKGLKSALGSTVKNTLGMTTGAGSEAIGTAYQAGKSGATNFVDNMRGNVPVDEVLGKARDALSQMRQQRGDAYRSGMAAVSKDKSVIPFAPIEQAMSKLQTMGSYKGQVINKNAAGTVDELADIVNQWKSLDPAEYHTPEGMDALKKAIGDVRDSLQYGTPARTAADNIYNAVKNEITMQAPTYSKVMKDYQQASELLSEIERTLSLKPGASVDTSMRKLQSLMRNNVNTNFGNRLNLSKQLEQKGGKDILNDVAGQALNSWTPRGLQAATGTGAALAAIPTGGASLALLPVSSPRLVGEAAYGLGAGSRRAAELASLGKQKLTGLLGMQGAPRLTIEQLAPLLATAPAVAFSQR